MKNTISIFGGILAYALFLTACGGGGGGSSSSAKVTGSCTGISSYGLNVTSATASLNGPGKFNVTIMGAVVGGSAGQTGSLLIKQIQYFTPSTFPLNTALSVTQGANNFNALYQTANPASSNISANNGVVSFSSYNSTEAGGLVAGALTGLTFSGVSSGLDCTLNGSFSTHTETPAPKQ